MKIRLAPLALVAIALVLSGCAGAASGTAGGAASSDDGIVRVVASTNVYGSIATTVGGSSVEVTSIIDSPQKNPHEYEVSARDVLAVKNADLVIENGAGYDDFMTRVIRASGTRATVLNVAELSGYDLAGGNLNEHLWYDYPTMTRLVARIQAALATAAPGRADAWTAGGTAAQRRIAALQRKESELKPAAAGRGVAVTEPLPLYVLQAIGLQNRTPPAFSAAVESGTDASPRVLQETLDLLARKEVALLVYNMQTAGPQADAVKSAAERAGVPVVGITETVPPGQDYAAWQARMLGAVGTALRA